MTVYVDLDRHMHRDLYSLAQKQKHAVRDLNRTAVGVAN